MPSSAKERMEAAESAAFLAPATPIASVITGMPAGICTIERSESWEGGDQSIEANWHFFDVDNGYDAFSLDNTRQTLSDEPGRDTLKTHAGRLKWRSQGSINLSAQLSVAKTDTEYAYDEDWAYVGIAPALEYSSFDTYLRDRDMQSVEIRADRDQQNWRWTLGGYLKHEQETLTRRYTYLENDFNSELTVDTGAIFGQVDFTLTNTQAPTPEMVCKGAFYLNAIGIVGFALL